MSLKSGLQDAAQCVRDGGVLAHPTEAVWGLGCDPFNQAAVAELCRLKARSLDKGLIILIADLRQLEDLMRGIPNGFESALQDAKQYSATQATTFLLRDEHESIPQWIKGGFERFALRLTDHQPLCELLEQTGPLVSTSANPSGQEPARSEAQLLEYFGAALDIYSAPLGSAKKPSRIIDLETGDVIR